MPAPSIRFLRQSSATTAGHVPVHPGPRVAPIERMRLRLPILLVGLALSLGSGCGSVSSTTDGGGEPREAPPDVGGPRGKGRRGGLGGTGGVSCGDLATQYANALPAAQSCDLNASRAMPTVRQLLAISLFLELHDLRERSDGSERYQGELGTGGLQQCRSSVSRDRLPATDQQHVPRRRWWRRHLLLEQRWRRRPGRAWWRRRR